jgi:hypothetical protein
MKMTVQKNANETYYSYRDGGALECWGIVDMFIPEGGSHMRQGYLYLPKYAEAPSVTANLVGIPSEREIQTISGQPALFKPSSGTSFVIFDYTFDDNSPDQTLCKVTATNMEAGQKSDDIGFICHFHAIGIPAIS